MDIKKSLIPLTRLAPALALLSCAAPKAVVVEEAPVSKKESAQQTAAAETEPAERGLADDGIRLPDMLGLPGESEFRSSRPATTSGSGSGAVIARPPVEANPPP